MGLTRAITLVLLAGSAALGQQYPFLPVPGSPKNVRVLFQDSKGRLWLGGDQLACFDGAHLFYLADYGFPSVESYDIKEDSSGAVWIGAASGVYRFSDGHVEEVGKGVAVSVIPLGPGIVVASIGPAGRGVPENPSLVRIERTGKSWTTATVISLDSPGLLTLDRGGSLLYAWPDKGWNEIRLEDVIRWHPGEQLPVKQNPVPAEIVPGAGPIRVLRDRSGCVWIGSHNENIYNCGDKNWRFAPFEGAEVGQNLGEAPDGAMLLAGYNTLAVGRPGKFRIATAANGLPVIFTAMQARDGTLWLGSSQGLYRFASHFGMEYWTARDGAEAPWAIQRTGADIYAGVGKRVAVLSADRQRWQTIRSFQTLGQVVGLLPTQDGNLFVALNPEIAALIHKDGTVLASSGASEWYGLRLAIDQDHNVWLGGVSLGRLHRSGSSLTFENHRLETQPAGNVLDVQFEESTRKLWACYNGGLVVRDGDGRWREITTKDGLLVNGCWSLAALPNGDVWYGYYNTPAFALVHPTADGRFSVRQFREGEQIRDPESLNFDVDTRGWLWRGGNRGLSVASQSDAEAGRWLYLDESDGLSGVGVNNGSYFADPDGSIWVGLEASILHYLPPSNLVTPQFSPQVFLSAFSWVGSSPRLAEAITALPHGTKVVAHIGSLQFDRRNNLRVRYRVLPEQSSWHESSGLDLPLGLLSAGAHSLEVQGRVFTGPWSETARRSFLVLRPIWITWPFLTSYFTVGMSLLAGGYLWHRKRQAERAELLPNLAAWRLSAVFPEAHELAGTILDSRFEVGELLARGGFANVLKAYDRDQQTRCAVKVFRGEVKDKAWIQRRFEQEVAALGRIRHPHVVSIYAHGRAPSGAPYLVMEFIEGRNLREVLESGALSAGRAARLLRQLAAALDAIHAQDIWHRDVKPENVIVRHEGSAQEEAMLIDFSIAIVKDANETLYGLSRAAGSFDYMAPEQAIGYADSSSDIYSLAKVAIEMLAGQRLTYLLPDASLDLPNCVRELLQGLDVKLSGDAIDMLATALEFDPARRPRVAGSFIGPILQDLAPEFFAEEN
jgi:tRNA A-37 threonylcarbamoyl transferase component Bud32